MDELVKLLSAEIKAEARRAVEEFLKAVEMFADLPGVSTTQELAKVLRVSDDVVRRTAEEGGMPHVHVGRELRFVKNLIAEWSLTGKNFSVKFAARNPASRRCPPRLLQRLSSNLNIRRSAKSPRP